MYLGHGHSLQQEGALRRKQKLTFELKRSYVTAVKNIWWPCRAPIIAPSSGQDGMVAGRTKADSRCSDVLEFALEMCCGVRLPGCCIGVGASPWFEGRAQTHRMSISISALLWGNGAEVEAAGRTGGNRSTGFYAQPYLHFSIFLVFISCTCIFEQ